MGPLLLSLLLFSSSSVYHHRQGRNLRTEAQQLRHYLAFEIQSSASHAIQVSTSSSSLSSYPGIDWTNLESPSCGRH
ncbi:hypothetical protein TNCV_4190781 [Trichonephila clavipes]|nr:hypothetical protein TNCV_4190781 [Trichonephila clavipes]